MTEAETFLARAADARAEADNAMLDNVRERCLRSEAAWTAMADRATKVAERRAEREALQAQPSNKESPWT